MSYPSLTTNLILAANGILDINKMCETSIYTYYFYFI